MSVPPEQPFDTYLSQVLAQLRRLPPERRAAVADELRAHLHDAALDSSRSPTEANLQAEVIRALCSPQRLGRALVWAVGLGSAAAVAALCTLGGAQAALTGAVLVRTTAGVRAARGLGGSLGGAGLPAAGAGRGRAERRRAPAARLHHRRAGSARVCHNGHRAPAGAPPALRAPRPPAVACRQSEGGSVCGACDDG